MDYYPLMNPWEFKPVEFMDLTAATGTTGDPFIFKCQTLKHIAPSMVTVKYWYGNNIGSAINASMTGNSFNEKDIWTLKITVPSDSTDDLNYEISVLDKWSNWRAIGPKAVTITDNDAPDAFAGTNVIIYVGDTVTFDATKSTDNIGIVKYLWYIDYFGKNVNLVGAQKTYTFNDAGDFQVTLKLEDAAGNIGFDFILVSVYLKNKPRIVGVNYPATKNIYESIQITASVGDLSSEVKTVKIDCSDANGNSYNDSMAKQYGDVWSYTIPVQNSLGIVEFFIYAENALGKHTRTVLYSIKIVDNIKPEIWNITYPVEVQMGNNMPISANVQDNIGISEVRIYYSDINGQWYNVNMAHSTGVIYTYSIPAQIPGGIVEFYIYAEDQNSNTVQTKVYNIRVLGKAGDEFPKIEWLKLPEREKVGESINIQAKVFGEFGITEVYLNFVDVNGTEYNETMEFLGLDKYNYTISAQNAVGIISAYIAAENSKGYWANNDMEFIQIYKVVPDTSPPFVESTTPENDAEDVAIDAEVLVVFNESILLSSVDVDSMITISPAMNFSVTWSNFEKKMVIHFTTNLDHRTTYTISLSNDLTDLAGNKMIAPYTFKFSTETGPVVDTDNDNIPDYWEDDHGLDKNDPNDAGADVDGDKLTNLEEYLAGTDLKDKDSDSDGLPDGWEVENLLEPLVNDAEADPDDDSYSNIEEYKGDSDPQDRDSIPEKKDEDKGNFFVPLIIIIIVVIIIILLLAAMMRRKKGPVTTDRKQGKTEEGNRLSKTSEEDSKDLEIDEDDDTTSEDVDD
jgi:hypothetical protein